VCYGMPSLDLRCREQALASADSMGWHFGARERGISNMIAHRSDVMSRWMEKAQTRAMPAHGGNEFTLEG
jgi:hypothetical protein